MKDPFPINIKRHKTHQLNEINSGLIIKANNN